MKISQLIEYNRKNISSSKTYKKYGEDTFLNPSLKKSTE